MPKHPDDIRAEMESAAAREAAEYSQQQASDAPDLGPIPYQELNDAFHRGEYGDASLAVRLLQGKYCFDNASQTPYYFNCTHWIKDINNNHLVDMERVAIEYERQLQYYDGKYTEARGAFIENQKDAGLKLAMKDAKSIRDAWSSRIKELRKLPKIKKVWELATSGRDSLGMDGSAWNANPLILPCKNCVIDLETGKALKGIPEQYFNKASPYEYHGMNVEAPLWDKFLEQIFCGKIDLKDYFSFFAGSASTGIQTKDFFCAYGPHANNGKSLLFSVMQKLLGDFVKTLNVELLLEEKFVRNPDAPSHSRLKLFGCRLAITSEAQANQFFSFNKIKHFTSGGDTLEARGINAKHEIEFPQTASLVLHTNDLPKPRGSDKAFYDRLKILEFMARFIQPHEGPEEPDKHIYHARPRDEVIAELLSEAPGILAYFVRYAKKFIKLGAMPEAPACVMNQVFDYKNQHDVVGQFLMQCCTYSEFDKEQMKYIYWAFKRWSIEEKGFSKKNVWSQNYLGTELVKRPELRKEDGRVAFYHGIKLRDDWRFQFDKYEEKGKQDDEKARQDTPPEQRSWGY